jgi:hypothetical protein
MPGPNPYTPGAGDRPRALVGRSDQLALAESVRTQIEASYSANSLVYIGLRGVGKTVLLKEISDRLFSAGWYAPYLEMRRGLPVDQALAEVAERFAKLLPGASKMKRQLGKLLREGGGLQVLGTGMNIGAGRPQASYADLARVLEALAQAAREDGVGVAILVDELQSLPKVHLGALIHLVQDLRNRLPFAFFGAGLPHLPAYIAQATTYTERFRYEPTDSLGNKESRAALAEPAIAEGAVWDDDALDEVVKIAQGYPYFLQLYAYESWEAAGRTQRVANVTLAHVKMAQPIAERQIETGIYAARFGQTTESERRYLFAMIDVMGRKESPQVRSSEVASAMNRGLSDVSPIRDNIIRKGIIHSPEHGFLMFSIPGFREYLARKRVEE